MKNDKFQENSSPADITDATARRLRNTTLRCQSYVSDKC